MATTKKTITVTQIGSLSGQKPGMRENLLGIGLGSIGKTMQLEDTPAVRGMITKVRHLVTTNIDASPVKKGK
jgi:large subunit ribosomal protein L30